MPPVKFYLDPYSDDTPFVLGANDIFEPLSEARDVCILLFSVAPVDAGGTWILGDTFLRKFAVMFDFTHHRVGFALRSFSQSRNWITGKSDSTQITEINASADDSRWSSIGWIGGLAGAISL